MARPKRTEAPKLLTEVELEIMSCLWTVGRGTVRDVIGALPAGRELAYTSVATILRVLEDKGMVEREKRSQPHVYQALLKKEVYESRSVNDLVDRVFGGAPTALVARLLDERGLSTDELKEIKRLLKTSD